MRIDGPNRIGKPGSSGAVRRTGASGFSLPGDASAAPKPAAMGAGPLADIGSLLALQEVDAPDAGGERRRRMAVRGRRLLDVLDEIKVGLLSGGLGADVLDRLESALAEAREETGEAGLDGLLDAIEVRARVEAAKLSRLGIR